ncbi:MAG: hypothetical protein IJT53_09420 [Prevotella sp.]|nr:hypothetical protein [Prevotella sp.]
MHRRGATHILALILILLGGMANEAWATVTYHILTLPLNSSTNNTQDTYNGKRLEALRCTSNDLTVGLPEDYKSPLATGFTYYAASDVIKSDSRQKIYANNNTSFDTYTIAVSPTALSEGDDIADGSDIYVTYTYNSSNTIADLTGATEYNIQIGDRFLAFNGDRGNRPGSILKTAVTASQLVSDEFTYITNGVNNNHNFFFKWKFLGSDPYNIVVATAYTGSGTYDEGSQKKKKYAESSLYAQLSTGGSVNKVWLSNETDRQWSNSVAGESTLKPGFYRSMNPVFTSFVLLNHKTENYTLVSSVVNTNGNNWQPNASGQYMHLMNNTNIDPEVLIKDATDADQIQFWPIETYTFKVRTPLTSTDVSATGKLSSYTRVNEPTKQIMTSEVPSSLRRKYCSFTYFYKEAAKTNQITTYAQAYDNSKVIYVDYTVSGLPFQTSTNYTTAKWYNIKKYGASAFLGFDTSNNQVYSNGSNTATDTKNQFAFIGDPYELRIINRYKSIDNSANYYAGFSSDVADQQMTVAASPTVYTWEIEYETRTTDFLLRSFNRGTPLYWNWEGSGTTVVSYKTEGSKVVVSELPQYTYKYHIIRSDGTEAIYASISQDATIQLSLATLPSIIVSPYLVGETLTFYSDASCSSVITEAPTTNNADIYVKYTTTTVSSKTVKLNNTDEFNVKLNGEYIYWDTGTSSLKTTATLADASDSYCLWRLEGGDPYAMKIYNKGLTKYLKATFANDEALAFDTETNASLFIAKLNGSIIGEYEVMAATGSGTDASSTYYNIGRSATNVVKIYSNSSYAHGTAQLKFILEQTRVITYHLIDKSKTELLAVTSKSPDLHLPSEYVSPLVETYHYYTSKADADAGTSAITTMPSGSGSVDIYVNYDVNDLISFNVGSKMYRLRFANGVTSWQEDGKDGVSSTKLKAYYPYANGDCNFFVYGDEQKTEQLGGAASTRTRWPWYVESLTSDPYHVKIVSRQQQANDGVNHRMYFRTYKPDGYDYIVTGLTMPGISENSATEYMVLGEVGAYKLVTTETVTGKLPGDAEASTARRTVTSFEQYWKTWETLTQKGTYIDDNGNVTVHPNMSSTDNLTDFTSTLHSYTEWAYTRPVQKKSASKRFADETHWFHTVSMGNGAFDFEEMEITPVLVLLDQHGWEIMRKPLPTGTNDPDKEAKYDAIRPYNSPMVERYYFFNNATKETGYHRYTLRVNNSGYRDFIKWNGAPYYSTDLTDLPPFTASGVTDSFGDVQDQYVVYTVKDEYAQNLNQEFLVVQGGQVAKTEDGSSITGETPSGGLSAWITAGSIANKYKWKVTLNDSIDAEMGKLLSDEFKYASNGLVPNWPAADGKGFDPYNIQIESVANTGMLFTTNATSATLSEGSWTGNGSSVSLATAPSPRATSFTASGHDNKTVNISNQTFMAVADANGNMQLMPRFDHSHRVQAFTALADPQTNSAGDQTGTQTTFMLRPLVYEYIIVDNQGRESLRYKAGGEFYPGIPAHFKSPLAKDFEYYKKAVIDNDKTKTDAGYYTITESTEETTSEDEITGSFAAAGLSSSTNTVYVRYKYDEVYDTDHDLLLQGPWLTVSLGGDSQWIYYNGTLNVDGSGIFTAAKPDPITTTYQWKFLRSPYVDDESAYLAPDPYAVTISNREANAGSNKNTALQVGTAARYALLSHPSGGYALAVAGTGNTSDYTFLNGNGMTAHDAGTPQAAAINVEASFSPASSTISDHAQLQVTNDVTHNYTYHIITRTGVQAVSATQTNEEAVSNSFVPTVPYGAQSPLLNIGDYAYYGIATESSGTYTIITNTHITSLYGIYNDEVFVKYDYDASTSPFRVPNVKGTTGEPSHVTKGAGSNDSPLDIGGELGYNIIWYNDNMMYNNSGSVGNAGSLSLTGTTTHVWQFVGSDPYALQIKNKGADKYLNGTTTLADDASTTFMLLRKTDYDYGILQATGTSNRLTNYGEQTTTGDPTKYVIFALATYKLYYNLLVGAQNTDLKTIPVRTMASGEQTNTTIKGTSMRTSAPAAYDAGTVSLGDALATPYTLSRPFCTYTYYIDVVQNSDASANTELTNKYQGLLCTNLPDDADLIGKIMYVDVAYQFDDYTQDDYEANPAFRFETDNTNSSTTKWYTAESRSTIPFLVNYKYGTTTVGASAGRDQHCTNDHLWCPVGDPYGFYMHNRYATKNHNGWSEVMTTSNPPAANAQMTMSTTTTYAVYEMIPTSTDGYFRLHPLSGAAGLYVWGTLEAGVPVGKLSLTNSTDWIFNLTTTQLEPYYARKGYVGGLNSTGVAAYEAANGDLRTIQGVVYNDVNIQSYASGYYRLHSIPSTSISPVRYMSGYTHKTELTPGSGTDVSPVAIPLHFYEQAGTSSTFYGLGGGFTETSATRGELSIPAVEYDPASIFYFDSNNRIRTQGLEVKEYKMTDTANDGTQFTVEDIGAAVVTLRNGTLATGNYLNYNQSTDIYDLKYTTGEMLDYTKWCMQPVQKAEISGAGEKALLLTLNSGGDGYYYATFCAPFDVTLPSTATAYVCTAWDTKIIHPVSIDQTIPAGTPAIIRSTAAGPLTLTLPGTASTAETCVFSGKYLEQLLSTEVDENDKVYTFGLSITGLTLNTETGTDNGRVSGTDVTKATTGVGFYLNANPNKEINPSQALWTKNNRYVYANKIYYRTGGSGASARQQTRGVEFVPVVFHLDEDGQPGEDESVGGGFPVGICVYNLQGRCVATEQQVKDGSWRSQVPAGIYIMRPARGMSKGKKIVIK